MSGDKCAFIRIRRAEYERLMRACKNQDSLESFIKAVVEKTAAVIQEFRQRRTNTAVLRHEAGAEQLSAMSHDMRRMEQACTDKMHEHAQQIQSRIEHIDRRFSVQRTEYIKLIQEQSNTLNHFINEQRRELDQRISAISQQLTEKERGEREQAQIWASDTTALLGFIAAEYRSEKFQPGRLDQLQQEALMAQDNIDRGLYQAAIAAAQQSYLRAAELRLTLMHQETEWEMWLQAAQRSAAEMLALCDAQQSAQFMFETDQGAENIEAEVDYWTQGGLNRLRQLVETEIQRLSSPESLSLKDLQQSVKDMEQLRQECLELTEKAKKSLLASQLRNNIGLSLETALEAAGWTITDAVYQNEDFRQAVHVKLENLSGDEIVTIITPVQNDEQSIENKIEISFFDRSTNDESFRWARLKAITELLRREGIEISEPECIAGSEFMPSEQMEKLDFNRLRKTSHNTPNQ